MGVQHDIKNIDTLGRNPLRRAIRAAVTHDHVIRGGWWDYKVVIVHLSNSHNSSFNGSMEKWHFNRPRLCNWVHNNENFFVHMYYINMYIPQIRRVVNSHSSFKRNVRKLVRIVKVTLH